jgi:hypothetical protein
LTLSPGTRPRYTRREMPPRRPRIANDNARNAPPLQRYAWHIYRADARARWGGRVIASTVAASIAAAAVEFSTVISPFISRRGCVKLPPW